MTSHTFRLNFGLLNHAFHEKLTQAIVDTNKENDFNIFPYYGVRTPWEQARLWRQSRTKPTVLNKIDELRRAGANFLANCLEDVGAQSTKPTVTNAIPGTSWHQFGEAMDCYVEINGEAIWDGEHPGYKAFAKMVRKNGLVSGYFWDNPDYGHVQMKEGSPLDYYTITEIDEMMKEKFKDISYQ